jgi:hypothetical protein
MKKLAILVLSLAFLESNAQVPVDKNDATKKVTSQTLETSSSTGFISNNNFTKLNATNDGVSAEANVAYSYKTWNFNGDVSTPVNSKTDQVKPVSLNGLSNNAKLTLGIQNIFWRKPTYDQNSYNNAITALGKDKNNFSTSQLTDDELSRFYQMAKIDWGTAFYFGGKLTFEKQSFKYLTDTVSFVSHEISKIGVKFSLQIGLLNQWGIFGLSYSHQSGYKSNDVSKFFFPVNNTDVQIEQDLSIGNPLHQGSDKVRFEFLSIANSNAAIRINPRINLAFQDKIASFEFPLYFLTTKDNKQTSFNGGIYTGYATNKNYHFEAKTENILFGVFIGAAFNDLFH